MIANQCTAELIGDFFV